MITYKHHIENTKFESDNIVFGFLYTSDNNFRGIYLLTQKSVDSGVITTIRRFDKVRLSWRNLTYTKRKVWIPSS